MYYSVICIISVFEGYNIYNNTNNTYFIYTIYIIMVFLVLEKKRKIYSLSMSNENNTFFCIISVLMVLTEF